MIHRVCLIGLGMMVFACVGTKSYNEAGVKIERLEKTERKTDEKVPAMKTDEPPVLGLPDEVHLRDIKQLTFGGQNAEAYFNHTASELIFQTTRDEYKCDQIFIMGADGSNPHLVSTGTGRTTCAFFIPGSDRILFSSTHEGGDECPPEPDYSKGYTWPLYNTYEIYTSGRDGSDMMKVTDSPGYDAEATFSVDGSRIVFTSKREDDLDIYTMNPDGSDIRRLTTELGYDGGPFYNRDGTKIVYRAYHPTDSSEIADYTSLLAEDLIRPGRLDIFVMDADGSNKVQITDNGAANFAPYFHPDGEKIVFVSNLHNPRGRNFDIFLINVDGSGLERVTYNESFDGFPMFNADGTKLVFASNRNNKIKGDTNIFIADWVD